MAMASEGRALDIQALKRQLRIVLPIVDRNLEQAHSEWMGGGLPRGAFEYARARHEAALIVLSRDDLDAEGAYKACAPITIDLRSGIRDSPEAGKGQAIYDAWWAFYREAGFTGVHPLLEIPVRPSFAPEPES